MTRPRACVMTRSGVRDARRRLADRPDRRFAGILHDLGPKMDSESQCGRLLAHEIGHALTLPHVAPAGNLMNAAYEGEALTDDQVGQAKAAAREYYPTVNAPPR